MNKEKTIKISSETYELLKKIKKERGVNIKFVVDNAVKKYYEEEKEK